MNRTREKLVLNLVKISCFQKQSQNFVFSKTKSKFRKITFFIKLKYLQNFPRLRNILCRGISLGSSIVFMREKILGGIED